MTYLHAWAQDHFLDELVKEFGNNLEGASIRFRPEVTWKAHMSYPPVAEPTASVTFSRKANGLPGRIRAGLEGVFDGTFEGAVQKALDSDYERTILDNRATFDIEQPESDHTTMRMPARKQFVLDSAARFHERSDLIVRAHNRMIITAELHYGPLHLVNETYRR